MEYKKLTSDLLTYYFIYNNIYVLYKDYSNSHDSVTFYIHERATVLDIIQ